jgi:hypothetical protein
MKKLVGWIKRRFRRPNYKLANRNLLNKLIVNERNGGILIYPLVFGIRVRGNPTRTTVSRLDTNMC